MSAEKKGCNDSRDTGDNAATNEETLKIVQTVDSINAKLYDEEKLTVLSAQDFRMSRDT